MGLDNGIFPQPNQGHLGEPGCLRKNYVLRQWMATHLSDFQDNGSTPITVHDVNMAIRSMNEFIDKSHHGNTPFVSTPDCWYKQYGIDTNAGSPESLRYQAEEALQLLEQVRTDISAGIRYEYWESY